MRHYRFNKISLIGTSLGALSLFMLGDYYYANESMSAVFDLLSEYYERLLTVVLVPVSPLIDATRSIISTFLGVTLTIDENWRHAFVLLWLYYSSSAKMIWTRSGSRFLVLIGVGWGAVCALFTAAIVGAASESGFPPQVFVLMATAGIVFFESGITLAKAAETRSKGGSFSLKFSRGFLHYVFPSLLIGLLLTIVLTQPAVMRSLDAEKPGLPIVFFYVLVLSVYWFFRACLHAFTDRACNQSRRERFLMAGGFSLSVAVFRTILTAIALVMINAGLSLSGL